MKTKPKSLTLLAVFALLAFVPLAMAQKGGKNKPPPQPPPGPSDPAIAYTSGGVFGGNLMVMNADGSNQIMLLDDRDFNNADPSWSPDGSQLVFLRYHLHEGSINVIDKNGGNPRVLLHSDHYQFDFPRWSPTTVGDGEYKILYLDAGPGGPSDLYLMNLDGSGITNITNTPGEDEFCPSWDPTAGRIVALVAHLDAEDSWDIVVYDVAYSDLDGDGTFSFSATASMNLTESGPLKGANLDGPSWAKTGNKILVSALLPGESGWSLWKIDLTNPADPERLSQDINANPFSPSFSEDDSRIVYRYNAPWTKGKKQPSGIFVMNADGTGVTNDGYPADGRWPDWRRCCPECLVVCAE